MTSGGEMLGSDLVAGQPVVFDGEDITAGILGPDALVDALRRGHPGLIRDPTPQHIMINRGSWGRTIANVNPTRNLMSLAGIWAR